MDILVVDDSKVMRSLVRRAIKQAGFRDCTFDEAENGEHALSVIAQAKPRLVLSDWNMPVMSGIDFLRALRSNGNDVPFGFVTSEASKEISELAAKSGASFVITKPFSADSVQDALSPFLS